MEITDNAHSISAPDVPITSQEPEGVFKGDVPMNTTEAVKNDSLIEPPFSMYEQMKNTPYTIDYLKLEQDSETIKMARGIDEFVHNEIDKKHLTDSLDSYHSIIERLKDVLGVDPNEQSSSILEKMYMFIKQYRNVLVYNK